ncbi:tetratricopeptide repeat protein, partial [Streptomyces vinaceus]
MLEHLITQDDALRMIPIDRHQLTGAVEKTREELRALPEGTDPARARPLARWTGIGMMVLGYHQDAITFLRQALDLATTTGNSRAVIATKLNLGDAHRYAGAAGTADALYRQALDAAQKEHPELVDYALQHLGKHLMERGDLKSARAHLWEARRLRMAKNDAGLIESTQAAIDRVELLIQQTGADDDTPWSRQWTSWLQSRTTARTSAGWEDGFPAIRGAVQGLTAHERVRPRHLREQPFPTELFTRMAEEAEKTLAADGYLHNGKWNAVPQAHGQELAHHDPPTDLRACSSAVTATSMVRPGRARPKGRGGGDGPLRRPDRQRVQSGWSEGVGRFIRAYAWVLLDLPDGEGLL